MTKSTITREQLLEIIETDHVQCGEASALARMALAAMDSEPNRNPVLAYADSYRDMAKQGVESVPIWSVITDLERNIAPLYRHAQPAPVVSAELLHTAASAIEDLLTTKDRTGAGVWFDLPFRLRSAANAQPAPVVPDAYVRDERGRMMLNGVCEPKIGFGIGWNACRAAMLAAAPQSPGSEPATVPGKWIPVSERMPEVGDIVLTAMGGAVNVGEMECSAANCRFFTSVISGRELPATHWMPLPAAPQEPSLACISKRSQHLS